MKKTIISIAAAALCASALSAPAFAADILSDRSVYAADRESIASSAGSMEWNGETVTVDPNTLTPLYYVDFYDYARTGIFDVQPYLMGEYGQNYMSDAVNSSGDYAGEITLTVNSSQVKIHEYWPTTDRANSLSFTPNAKRISALMAEKKISSDCKEVKLVYINEIGHVYYIDNGETKLLAAANMGGVNGEIFNKENGGIVEINDDLKAAADRMLAELEEYQKYLETLGPGENPPTMGGNDPTLFVVDNTPYLDEFENPPTMGGDENPPTMGGNDNPSTMGGNENPPTMGGNENPPTMGGNENPNTGGTGMAVASGLALAACGISFHVLKKKKD